jgi:hypothetical protein
MNSVTGGLKTDLAVDEVIALRLLLILHILRLSLLGLVRPNRCSVMVNIFNAGFRIRIHLIRIRIQSVSRVLMSKIWKKIYS